MTLDDPESFSILARTAAIAIPYEDLGRLLNDFVFNYEGSNVSKLEVKAEDGLLRQDGVIHKVLPLPFTILAEASVTEQGLIRLHPVSIRVAGIPAGGLLDLLSVELDGLIRNNRAHGVRVEGNDLLLDPAGLLPPPRLLGQLTGLTLGENQIFQRFGQGDSLPSRRFPEAGATLSSYMFLQHSGLRFGRLTMTDAWMLVVDEDQSDWFDFSLGRYHEQLVAGNHETTADAAWWYTSPRRRSAGCPLSVDRCPRS